MCTDSKYSYYGFPEVDGLDRLFATPNPKYDKYEFSFKFPKREENEDNFVSFSNNITILGMPGTGKSTLALSMAAGLRYKLDSECAGDINNKIEGLDHPNETCSILYFSLEQSLTSILDRLNKITPGVIPFENVPVDKSALPNTIESTIGKILAKNICKYIWEHKPESKTKKEEYENQFVKNEIGDKNEKKIEDYIKDFAKNLSEKTYNDLNEAFQKTLKIKRALKKQLKTDLENKLKKTLLNSAQQCKKNSKKAITLLEEQIEKLLQDTIELDSGSINSYLPQHSNNEKVKNWFEENVFDKKALKKYIIFALINDIAKTNCILFPKLSPLPLISSCDTSDVRGQGVFWRRFEELKNRIEMVQDIARKDPQEHPDCDPSEGIIPPLRMVVIDSLSMFTDAPLTRYMVDQLFELFAEKNVMGVLILESNSENSKVISESNANVTAAADVVIKLSWNEKENYSFRQINITKSRHSPNNYGNHLMKMADAGCRFFPSLHAWHPLLGNFTKDKPDNSAGCQNILIYGQKHTRKIEFAKHCLNTDDGLKTLLPQDMSNNTLKKPFLLISFGETSNSGSFTWGDSFRNDEGPQLPPSKGVIYKGKDDTNGWLMKIHSGALLPEELIWYIDKACASLKTEASNEDDKVIKTIIFKNVSSWEYSYPLLYENVASQHDIFFPILRRYCAYRKLACIFTCSEENSNHPLLRTLKAMAQLSVHIERKNNLQFALSLPSAEYFKLTFDNKNNRQIRYYCYANSSWTQNEETKDDEEDCIKIKREQPDILVASGTVSIHNR